MTARRDEILELARRHGAANVRVFGSTARGQATAASDIDFLISLEEGRTLFDLGAFWHQLENLLGRDVDVVPDDSLDPRIQERILREAVAL
ncbi:MAG: nucleotidyltransferase [Chloroflexota bacterium]|nr:MAG: nucleotidyltransferase [Chloroflexota bacterium]